jgi:hypothetical protein
MFDFFWDLFSLYTATKSSQIAKRATGSERVVDSALRKDAKHTGALRKRRRALIIGINYKSLANKGVHLYGCVNDAQRMYAYVCAQVMRDLTLDDAASGEAKDVLCDVRVLCDEAVQLVEPADKRIKTRVLKSKPTRSAIERSLRWLASDADATTRLWLSYSGHGVSVRDENGDERDGKDEALVPLDYEQSDMILDDWVRENLVDCLPSGARLFGVVDCCHSGTALDLPITLEDKSRHVSNKSAKQVKRYKRDEWRLVQQRTRFEKVAEARADVVMVSGCRDNQTSADAWEDRMSTGALTHAFLKYCDKSETMERLLQDMSTWLVVHNYKQRPLLSFGAERTESAALRAKVQTI